ncbi:MAG: PLDc N-terminal domain-containing protein, partial [Thiotrichaceae bacterium]
MNLNWHQWLSSGLLLLDMLIILVLLPTVIQQRRESGATLAWVLAIVFLPFIGLISFWLFGTTRLYLRRRKRRKVEERLAPELQRVQSHRFEQHSIAGIPPSLLKLAHRLDHIGPVGGNQIELYRDGKLAFQAIEDAIAQAQHHI